MQFLALCMHTHTGALTHTRTHAHTHTRTHTEIASWSKPSGKEREGKKALLTKSGVCERASERERVCSVCRRVMRRASCRQMNVAQCEQEETCALDAN